ncbi:MAG: DNA polymerase III subunit delta [Chitinophagales bacterium]|nr:DNA polymerase III subunit delta [Bacteroidota bacterium]
MAVTIDSIWKDLQANKFAPVYFLCGEEPYYIDLIENYISDNALAPHEKDFNYSLFYGKDADVVSVLNDAKQYPTFAERRVVVVREAQYFTAENFGLFEKYFANPISSTILVFAHKNKPLDKRTKISKVIEKHTLFFDSKKIADDALPNWISGYVKSKSLNIKNDVAKLMAENLGNDLSRIANEVDKLSVMLADSSEITAELIEKYIGISKEYNVTEFNNAITRRDFSKAMKIALYFEHNPKAGNIIQVLAYMYNFFSKLLVLHLLKDVKTTTAAIGWLPPDVSKGTQFYSQQKTMEILQILCEYDAKAKGLYATNNNTNADLLKELIIKVVR